MHHLRKEWLICQKHNSAGQNITRYNITKHYIICRAFELSKFYGLARGSK
nr:MAG TPA: hypothetical protein [Bacteriophage sp.]